MHGARVGRTLWIGLVLAVGTLVVLNFTGHQGNSDSGSAAARADQLRLWLPNTELGAAADEVAREVAAGLKARGWPASVETLTGGSSLAVDAFLNRTRGAQRELLAISSTTLADMARDRRDPLVAEPHLRAEHALAQLSDAAPLLVLRGERLTLAVRADSPIRSTDALLDAVRAAPLEHPFALADDTWLKASLAAMVERAGLHDRIPYRIFPSIAMSTLDVDARDADVLLAPRSAIADDVRAGRLRELGWPRADRPVARPWVAIVAPIGLNGRQLDVLRRQLRSLASSRAWRRRLARAGLTVTRPSTAQMRTFLARNVREARTRQDVVAQVMRR